MALTLTRTIRDQLAEAAPPALIASVAASGQSRLGKLEHAYKKRAADKAAEVRRGIDWARVQQDDTGFVELMSDGGRAELTIDPALQQRVQRLLTSHRAPYASAVVMSVDDGRVLAMAGHSTAEPQKSVAELATTPWAPAASVFKLVTATALVEQGVKPTTRVCYHDGVHSVEDSNLKSNPRLDDQCQTLAYGLAKSQNAIIARLAHDHLTAGILERTARALGFGTALPFALPTEASTALLPAGGGLSFARVAAGFWQTTLSPLHGAWLAATMARGGMSPPMHLVDRYVDRAGNVERAAAVPERRVVSEAAARAVGRMMVGTTEFGTARLGFHDKRTGRPLLPGVAVAGKTGTLDRKSPYLSYSWFVGYAPAEKPEVAVAVLLGNGPDWSVKAHQVARELLASYFEGENNPHLARR